MASGRSVGVVLAVYMAVRLAIFVACLAVLYLLGLGGLLLWVVALLVSGVLSYPLARRQREDVARAAEARRDRRR